MRYGKAIQLTAMAIVTGMLVAISGNIVESHAQPMEIRIGALVEPFAEHNTTNNQWAMQLAVDALNDHESGSSSEYNIKLVPIPIPHVYDQNDARTVVGSLQQNYESGVKYFVGPVASASSALTKTFVSQTPDAIAITHGASAPMVPLSSTNIVNLAEPDDGFFRLAGNDVVQTVKLVNLINSEGREKIIILIRDEWAGIVNMLIPADFAPKVDTVTPYPIGPFTDGTEAISQHAGVAAATDARIGALVDNYGVERVSILFIGLPGDFVNHARAILADPSLENVRDVGWYTTTTIAGESDALADSSVGMFAVGVDLTGTAHTVESNDVNMRLCAELERLGGDCNPFVTRPYAAFDAVHLIADSAIAAIERGDESQARHLVLDVAAGAISHSHEDQHSNPRLFGGGALGDYALDAAGDLAHKGHLC